MSANPLPEVDVNFFVFNNAPSVAAAIESVLGQTWPAMRITLIDNGSDDGTMEVLENYAASHRSIQLLQNRVNTGAVLNCQRAFWYGNSAFVAPKTGDDIWAPTFLEDVMAVMMSDPACAMCHAAGLVFNGEGEIAQIYPESHRLHAVSSNAVDRAWHVMRRYTSAPSFWGVYRREAVNLLARAPFQAGWDHAVLAEMALYGHIRHVPEMLYWRRDGGKPPAAIAKACSEFHQRGLPYDGRIADLRWMTPLITTAYGHIETFARARMAEGERIALMQSVPEIFVARWRPILQQEAQALRRALPSLMDEVGHERGLVARWKARQVVDVIDATEMLLPEERFVAERLGLEETLTEQAMISQCSGAIF